MERHTGSSTLKLPDPLAAKEQPHLAAVSIKLPLFWPADPQVWFVQVTLLALLLGLENDQQIYLKKEWNYLAHWLSDTILANC